MNLAPASVRDYRERARAKLPRQLFDYIDGGAYEEATLRANEADLQALELRQRVMRDVGHISLRTTVLGRDLKMPVILAPVGLAGMFARRAEVAAARAAQAAGIVFTESTVSIAGIEEVAAATTNPFWFQIYVMRDRSYAESLFQRAAAVGCDTLVLTVDLAALGARYRDVRNGMAGELTAKMKVARALDFASHPRWVKDVAIGGKPHTFGNLEAAVPGAQRPEAFQEWVASQFDPTVTWDDVAWVRKNWSGNVVVKGVLDAEDARKAAAAGVDGIVVSNHGGRQLDGVSSAVRALPDVVEAVGDDVAVLVDGGVRSGLDVVKMLALGARATLVGRAWAWSVAAGGEDGVSAMLRTVAAEMRVAMALTGTTQVSDIDSSVLATPPRGR